MASCSAQPPNGNGDDNDEYGWKKTLPPGFVFCPTDVELITKYLKRKAQKLKISAGIISDLDIYNYHPQELEAYAFNHCDGRMYFFTPFRKKTNKGWRGDRAVADCKGYWKASQARATMIDCNNIVIGTKQSLVYYNGKGNKTSWLMSEFRFPTDSEPLPLYNETRHELALCVIYHNGKRAIIDDNQESEANLQSPNHMPTSCPNPNFIATSTMQNPDHPSSSVLNPNFIATSTLQNPNFLPSSAQNPNFIATSTLQNLNFLPSSAQNPNFIATSTLQNFNFLPSSVQNPNFIASSTLQNSNHLSSSAQNPNFIVTSTLQNPNFLPSSAQNPFLQDASELLPLPIAYNNTSSYTAISDPTNPPLGGSVKSFDKWSENDALPWSYEEIHSYLNDKDDNEDIPRLDILAYDSVASSCPTITDPSNQETLLYNPSATNVSKTCTPPPPQISPNNVNSNMSTATNHYQCADPTEQEFGDYEEVCRFLQFKDWPS